MVRGRRNARLQQESQLTTKSQHFSSLLEYVQCLWSYKCPTCCLCLTAEPDHSIWCNPRKAFYLPWSLHFQGKEKGEAGIVSKVEQPTQVTKDQHSYTQLLHSSTAFATEGDHVLLSLAALPPTPDHVGPECSKLVPTDLGALQR